MASLAPAEKAPSGKPIKVGSPHDPAEREADRIADILTAPEEPAMPVCSACAAGGAPCAACGGGDGGGVLRRQLTEGGDGGSGGEMVAPPSVHRVLSEPGEPLPGGLRGKFERSANGSARIHMIVANERAHQENIIDDGHASMNSSDTFGDDWSPYQARSSELKVSQPNDPSELEADNIADAVMRMPYMPGSEKDYERQSGKTGSATGAKHNHPKNLTSSGGVPISSDVGIRINATKGSGNRLDSNARNFFEPRFGVDLGNVNIHTGREATSLSRQLSAKAFTIGNDVYFDNGIYQPDSQSGREILAHELSHVLQQRQNGQFEVQRWAVPTWDEVRNAGYAYMIDGLRSLQREGIERLREWSATLSPRQQTLANGIITAVEGISGILIQLIFAVVGLVVGFVAGIVQMIVGLFELAIGILRGILLFLYGFIDGGAAFDEWAHGIIEAISNIPDGLRMLVTTWLAEFEHASTDRQVVMIGELTGQILALIATFEVAAARAGSLPRITATLPRLAVPAFEAAPVLAGAGSIGSGIRLGTQVVGGGAISINVATPAIVASQATLGGAVLMSMDPLTDLLGEGPESDAMQEADRRRGGMASRPQHHIFPREYRRDFVQRGFNDIDDFCVELEEASHQALHGGGDWRLGRTWPNEWNQRIMREIAEAESYMGRAATRDEIIAIGRELMVEYGIEPDFVRWRGAR